MDSRISNPMTVVQENESTSTTVTIRTDPSPDIVSNGAVQTNSSSDWLQTLTNTSIHINTSQLNDLEAAASSDQPVVGIQGGDWMSAINGARYYNNGKYIIGYVDSSTDLHHLLQEYVKVTGTSFPSIQQLNLATKATEEDYLQQRFLTPSARPRLFWQMHAGEPVIHFDGIPFITVGQCTDIPCVLAGRRRTTTQLLVATGDVLPTKIHTHGCTAKVSIRRIIRYPSSKLPDTRIQGITAMRKLRKQVLEVLTAKICAGLAKPCQRYYFSLPTPLAHDTHIVPEVEDPPSLIEPVHEEILRQISSAITGVGQIQEHIKKYVDKNYGDNPAINIQDSTFNPSRYELSRYIYWLYKSGRAIDQDCPFKERYSLTTEDYDNVKTLCTVVDQPSTDDDTLVSMYNMAVDETSSLASLELTAPQVGAEEVTGTTSPVSMTTKAATPTSRSQRKSQCGLLAVPKSNVFTGSPEYLLDIGSIQQSQQEVQSILTILENQTYACKDLNALQTLRRQLTALCTEFSVHLAGQKRPHLSPLVGDSIKRQHL